MERRYKLLSKLGVRNLAGYNAKIDEAKAREQFIYNPFSLTPEAPEPLDRLPHIVVVIDELADLMMVVGKKIEELIARLAQKARAAGIHLILATQRPSVDVITGLIKANIPTRIAFQVSSKIDSRTILDQMGAEALLGMGDMLYMPSGTGLPIRVHGAFVSDDEVHRVVDYLKSQGEPNYIEGLLEGGTIDGEGGDGRRRGRGRWREGPDVRPGGRNRAEEPQGQHLAGAAPSARSATTARPAWWKTWKRPAGQRHEHQRAARHPRANANLHPVAGSQLHDVRGFSSVCAGFVAGWLCRGGGPGCLGDRSGQHGRVCKGGAFRASVFHTGRDFAGQGGPGCAQQDLQRQL
jgi:hypothetical protein